MVKPIFQRYVQPNAIIYNTSQVAEPSIVNPLTGQTTRNALTGSAQMLTPTAPINEVENYMSLHLEFKPDVPRQAPKKGVETGEIVLQGRVHYTNAYYGVKPWYKPGGRYYCEVDFLGKGVFYALEQIESNLVTEARYFGYPILGNFLRLNGTTL